MAQISTRNDINVLSIKQFLGLNENPDGDTKIKDGELAEMRNFRVTQDKHLQIRGGTKTMIAIRSAWDSMASKPAGVEEPRFCGAWYGNVGGTKYLVVAFGGVLWRIDMETWYAAEIGRCAQDDTHFFGFSNKLYMLNGHEYMVWDGEGAFETVVGYAPIVYTACTPEGQGTLLENVNRLNGLRRVQYSPDGTAKDFVIPGPGADEVIEVEGATGWTFANNKVTFNAAPAKGTNTITVTYRKGNGARAEVESMRFSELYNGTTDSRVFLYGDGSNKIIYSGLDEHGIASAEYFPDLYEALIGEANTPVTSLVRHYSRLLAFKTDSAYSIQYGSITLDSGLTTAAFYVLPVNRLLGNEAMGQAKLLENSPLTLDGKSIYQWVATSTSGNITNSETNAKRVSDRVMSTLQEFDLKETKTFNRKNQHEYWFLYGGKALILNYANNAWYVYDNIHFVHMLEIENEVYGFTAEGGVMHFSREYRNDDGAEIDAYAATGAMDFGRDWQLKYSPQIYVAVQPESNARILVTVESDRRSDYPEKVVASSLATFNHVDFSHFSFATNRKPKVQRVKMKVKKATFYKLIYKSKSASATATVLQTDIQLRYAGNVK